MRNSIFQLPALLLEYRRAPVIMTFCIHSSGNEKALRKTKQGDSTLLIAKVHHNFAKLLLEFSKVHSQK